MTQNKIATELGRDDRFYFAGKSFSCRQLQRSPTMQSPEWLKPALYGAVGGAIALPVVGFSWGGWVTGGKAEMIADQRADVVAALTAICADQAKRDPLLAERVALLKTTASYGRGDLIIRTAGRRCPAPPSRTASSPMPAPTRSASRPAARGGAHETRDRHLRAAVQAARGRRGAARRRLHGRDRRGADRGPVLHGLSPYRDGDLPAARPRRVGSFQAVPVDPPALDAAIAADKAAG